MHFTNYFETEVFQASCGTSTYSLTAGVRQGSTLFCTVYTSDILTLLNALHCINADCTAILSSSSDPTIALNLNKLGILGH